MTTPRPYLSASQMKLLLSSEKSYIKHYFQGIDFKNDGIDFGRQIADKIQEGDRSGPLKILPVKGFWPEYEFSIKDKRLNNIEIYGKMDLAREKENHIIEVKTGAKWTQNKVDNDIQIRFYELAWWLEHGVIPKIQLYWFGTKGEPKKLSGETEVFNVKPSSKIELMGFAGKIISTWKRIKQLRKKYNEQL